MRPVVFGLSAGLIYFGLAMFDVFDGYPTWKVVLGFLSIALGIVLFVESLRDA